MKNNNLSWFLIHVPAIIMVLMLIYDYKNWKILTSYSGYFGIGFLIITLALNPIKSLKPNWIWVHYLNRYRRQLGVASFTYSSIHLACFIIKRIIKGFWEGLIYFLHPGIIPAFFIAFPILLILAATSNPYSIKKLSFLKWKKLHKTVYIAEIAIILHLGLSGSLKLALICFTPLFLLQFLKKNKYDLK